MPELVGRRSLGSVLVSAASAPASAPLSRDSAEPKGWKPKPMAYVDGMIVFGPWNKSGTVTFKAGVGSNKVHCAVYIVLILLQ